MNISSSNLPIDLTLYKNVQNVELPKVNMCIYVLFVSLVLNEFLAVNFFYSDAEGTNEVNYLTFYLCIYLHIQMPRCEQASKHKNIV